jgi:hypothetical protein
MTYVNCSTIFTIGFVNSILVIGFHTFYNVQNIIHSVIYSHGNFYIGVIK